MAAGTQPEGDDVLLLTPAAVETYATRCEFLNAIPASGGNIVLTSLCAHEGEELQTISFIRIRKSEDGLEIFDAEGTSWGAVTPCQ
jgi:hypothetical protein